MIRCFREGGYGVPNYGKELVAMCGICDDCYKDYDLVHLIKADEVPNDILLCDNGWSELSRIWGRYGWAKKIISAAEWREVCNARGYIKFGN